MSRRPPKITLVVCAVTGCNNEGRFGYDNQRDAARIHREQSGRWKCDKHRWVDIELRPDRPTSIQRLVATKHPGCGNALFWYPEGVRTGSGFASGPGFVANTEHWPEGAVLEVTARVLLPPTPGANVEQLDDHRGPWVTGFALCFCGKRWVATCPKSAAEALECPACGEMGGSLVTEEQWEQGIAGVVRFAPRPAPASVPPSSGEKT